MAWKEARFRGKQVWVEVDAEGMPKVTQGRVPMRYQAKQSAKVYRGGASGVTLVQGAESMDLGAGKPASKIKKGITKVVTGPPPKGTIVGYTDGACRGNPGPAGSGVWLLFPDERQVEVAHCLGRATNNIAELKALGIALEMLDEAEVPTEHPVRLYTDSSYCIGVLAKGWKAKKNQELIAEIKAQLTKRPIVELTWVKGHSGVAGNERADQLAVQGSQGSNRVDWTNKP